MGRVERLEGIFGPIMVMLYTLPRLALAPLFVLWFGIGTEFKVAFSSIIVFFLVYYSTYSGVREVPTDLIAAMRVMGASRMELITKVIFPSALVWVVSGLKVSVPYGLVGVIVGEMLVSNEGLGYLIVANSNQYNTAGVFAAILALLVVGFAIDKLITLLSNKALSWKNLGTLG
jgi:NitT/TauT family transport system permease protein